MDGLDLLGNLIQDSVLFEESEICLKIVFGEDS